MSYPYTVEKNLAFWKRFGLDVLEINRNGEWHGTKGRGII